MKDKGLYVMAAILVAAAFCILYVVTRPALLGLVVEMVRGY